MYKNKRILAVIPARGRNDEIENMNMRLFGEYPLIYYTIQVAKNNKNIDELIVSTEDKNIAEYAKKEGVKVPYLRSKELVDNVFMTDILNETVSFYEDKRETFDYIMALYPNAPFKTSEILNSFIKKINDQNYDVVIPVYGNKGFFLIKKGDKFSLLIDKERRFRKDTEKKYEERGGIYIYKTESLKNKKADEMKMGAIELDFHHSRMINTLYDLYLLDRLIKLPEKLLKDMQKFE